MILYVTGDGDDLTDFPKLSVQISFAGFLWFFSYSRSIFDFLVNSSITEKMKNMTKNFSVSFLCNRSFICSNNFGVTE